MPNHYHLLVKQLEDKGISEFINKVFNSYTKYFNTKHNRVGPLLQGQFKAIRIGYDEQFIHVSRYIHLNPITSFLVRDLRDYPWSSYQDFIGLRKDKLCNKSPIMSFFKSSKKYEEFVLDQVKYGQSLEIIKHLAIDYDN